MINKLVEIKWLRKLYRYTYKTVFSKYDVIMENHVQDCETLLDIGCGSFSPVQTFNQHLYCVGIDAFAPSIEKSKKLGIHDEYHQMNVLDALEKFGPKSFDVVVALDLIEHLTKEDGEKLLDMMDKLAKKRIFIYTPNGFLPQGDRENNPWQVHYSGWEPKEFSSRGYHVYGVNGVKGLRGEYAKVIYKPMFFWSFISDITELFVKNKPEKAFQLLAVKKF